MASIILIHRHFIYNKKNQNLDITFLNTFLQDSPFTPRKSNTAAIRHLCGKELSNCGGCLFSVMKFPNIGNTSAGGLELIIGLCYVISVV